MYKFTGLLMLLFLSACRPAALMITYPVTTAPLQPLQPAPQKVLVLNTFDAATYQQRKNKESLVAGVTDSLLTQMATQLQQSHITALPIYGLTTLFTSADEGSILKLMAQQGASHAIVIKEVDLFFEQTEVEVTRTQNGKSREAFYDICTNIHYELYDKEGKTESYPVQLRRQHSSRSVVSGALALGPSLANNSKAFYQLASQNKDQFLHRFFPVSIDRKRPLFTTNAFQQVGAAIAKDNFEQAFKESLLLTESSNRETVAKAYYNCAVLSERLNDFTEARRFLNRSIRARPLPEAWQMQNSMGH